MTPSDVLAAALAKPVVGGVRIVGVDGPSASGKSTFARALVALSGAPLVECDDFVSWGDLFGWWPRFDTEVLTPLLERRDATYRVRDWAGDEFGDALDGWKTTPAADLVVVEGLGCTRRETVGRIAYAVWVEAPVGVQIARGVARDGESHRHLWERSIEVQERFFAADGTRERADAVILTA
jgi:uridine kinase